MTIGKVTADGIKRLKPGERDDYLWDTDCKGFGVKVTPTGSLIFILQYRMGGRGSPTRRYTIGKHPALKPDAARKIAESLLAEVAKGEDVATAKRERRRVVTDLAFNAFVAEFCKGPLKAAWPKSWRQTQQCLELHAVPTLRAKPLPDVMASDVRGLLRKLDGKPATRRNLWAALSYLFAKAKEDGLIAETPLLTLKAPPQAKARDRTLVDDELRWLWTGIDKLPAPYDDVFRSLMLVGQRRGEVAGLPWSELDRSHRVWSLPGERAKNGSANVVPLTDAMVAMLDKRAGGVKWPRKGLVFPSSKGTALSGFSKIKTRLDAHMAAEAEKAGAEFKPWRVHDLRRTLATNCQRLGVPFEVIEHLLNHKEAVRSGIRQVYQTHGFTDEKREACEKWDARLASIVGGSTGVVIPLPRRKQSA